MVTFLTYVFATPVSLSEVARQSRLKFGKEPWSICKIAECMMEKNNRGSIATTPILSSPPGFAEIVHFSVPLQLLYKGRNGPQAWRFPQMQL